MTAADHIALPARIVLVNAVPGAGGRELAHYLHGRWGIGVVPVDDLELGVHAGRPGSLPDVHVQDDPVIWRTVVQVGATMAHAYRPLVVAPVSVRSRYVLDLVRREWHARSTEMAHVVLTTSEMEVRSRVHGQGGHPDARRWALAHAADAIRDLAELPADVSLDARWEPPALAAELVTGLTRLGWLDGDRRWVAATGNGARSDA